MNKVVLSTLLPFLTAGLLATTNPLIKFKENKHQWPSEVRFMGEFFNGKVFLEHNAFVYEIIDPVQLNEAIKRSKDRERKEEDNSLLNGHVYKTVFLNAGAPQIQGEEQHTEYYNYFLGQDQSKWSSHIHAFKKINYTGLYRGIDMQVYSEGANFKYDLILAPGADEKQIRMQIQNAESVSLSNKNLLIKTNAGIVTESAPVAWQLINGRKVPVACEYRLDETVVSFVFPEGYNKKYELIIDPVVIVCTFTGGTSYSNAGAATYDDEGNGYLGGDCLNQDFPVTTGAFQTTMNGVRDITFHKFNPDGSRLLHVTYLGGNSEERVYYMDVRKNEALLLGYTESADFPVAAGAFDNSYNGGADFFITKFDTSGSILMQSTFVGGSGKEGKPLFNSYEYLGTSELVRDEKGDIYVAGWTNSMDFPVTPNAYNNSLNTSISLLDDAILFKLDSAMNTMIWGTYFGGSSVDQAHSLRLDGNHGVYFIGTTASNNFPVTAGTVSTTKSPLYDCFVAHLDNTGTNLIASTFVGTSNSDYGNRIATDPDNNIYLFSNVEAPGSFQFASTPNTYNTPGRNIIYKLTPDLSQFVFKMRFGISSGAGYYYMFPSVFDVDSCGNIYVGGDAKAGYPTTPNAIKSSIASDDYDLYFAIFSANAVSLKYATYYGSADWEGSAYGKGRIDKKGFMYFSFFGSSSTSSSPQAWSASQIPHNTSVYFDTYDHGFLKLDPQTFLTATSYVTSQHACASIPMAFTNQSATNNVQWNFGDSSAPVFSQNNVSHTYTSTGNYNVYLIATDTSTCNNVDTLITQVEIHDPPKAVLQDTLDLCLEGEVLLDAGNPGSTYLWSTSATTQSIVTGTEGSFSVAITNTGCTITDQSEVIVSKASFDIGFPNIITPNGDGVNDKFDLSGFYVDAFSLHIFDRWGREVFSSANVASAWDGSIKGKVMDGTYFYTLSYTTDCMKTLQEAKGYITVIK